MSSIKKTMMIIGLAAALVSGQGLAAADHPELSEGDEAYSAGNYEKAAAFYRKDAELGVTAAQMNLAIMHLDGQGVPQDFQQAAKWFEKAAEFGNTEAQHNLAELYRDGKGVAKDPVLADKWFRLAGSANSVAQIEKGMSPEQIARATQQAEDWKANYKKTRGR